VRRVLAQTGGELRMVITDRWAGYHEHTEYRVLDADGAPVRRRGDLAGLPVYADWQAGGLQYHIRPGAGQRLTITVEQLPVVPAVKTPCTRTANPRSRCGLCAQEGT
jgi:hypothetical protein